MRLPKGSGILLMRALLIVVAAFGLATAADAQILRVELRDSTTGTPIVGAVVSALDATALSRADGLSNDRGVVTLRLPSAGTWTLAVRRIGIRPRRIPGITVDAGATLTVSLALTGVRQMLPSVRVTADAGTCGRAPEGIDRAATLWEQVSLALRASTLSREDSVSTPPLLIVERVRELDEKGDQRSQRVTKNGYGSGRPYTAVHPDTLAALGYVRRESDGDLSFFAPDELVLLSESFLATHCFDTPKEDADPSLAELRFRPIRGRSVPDVEGTAYVDTLTGELRSISFRFVAPRTLLPATAKLAGGDVALLRLPNGQWIVTSWAIRMPIYMRVGTPPIIIVRGYREVGGTVDPLETKPPDE
jgi:hypothetical protein